MGNPTEKIKNKIKTPQAQGAGKNNQVLPGLEPGSKDSESLVMTITLQDRDHVPPQSYACPWAKAAGTSRSPEWRPGSIAQR